LFAEWHLESEKVVALANGEEFSSSLEPVQEILIAADWNELVKSDPNAALAEQLRVRAEFRSAFAEKLMGRGFVRNAESPSYLLYAR
jgi:hypothetical protein